MKTLLLFATIIIALYTVSTRASAEEVYRCGSNYSQKPCPGAVVVDVQDSRTSEQKAESDAKTRRETAQVNALEKTQQKEEAQRRLANAKLAAAQAKKTAAKPRATKASAPALNGAESSGTKRKNQTVKIERGPTVFVARDNAGKPKAPKKSSK